MPGVLVDPTVNIPVLIEQGDSPSWLDYPFTDDAGTTYDASGYTLTYTLAGPTQPLNAISTPQGAGWQTALTTTQTAALAPNQTYWWQAVLSATGFALTVARGELAVTPNLALQQAGYSGLSVAEQNLLSAQAQLASVQGTESYKVTTREMKFRMVADIVAAISYWNGVVINERTKNSIAQNQGNPRKMYARFPSRWGQGL